jgi:tetratricopeptide (TPR) repeat protein
MNDVVILQIINSGFWLLIFGVSVFTFKREIGKLLQSVGSFKLAGSSFDFKDRKETLESYVLLAETLIDLVSKRERVEYLAKIIDATQVEKLSSFALKYTEETPRENWNEEMLINIAFLLLRHGRYAESIRFYDILLESRPSHMDLLNLKALAMITSRIPEQANKASEILSDLVDRYPEIHHIRFNFALAQSLTEKHDRAIQEMDHLIETPYVKQSPQLLDDPLFQKTKNKRTLEYERLKKLVTEKTG